MTDGLKSINFGWRNKLPQIFQSEAAECGLACLAMVATFHGHSEDLMAIRRRFGLSLKGSRLADLIRIGNQLDLASRPVRLEMKEMRELQLPCVLHWDMNHFVVLRQIVRGSLVIHDPAMGIRRVSMKEASRHFSGVALELTPASNFVPKKSAPRLRLSDSVGRIIGFKRSLSQLLAMALAIEVFVVIQPFFLQWIVDHALISGDRDLLVTLALGFGLLLFMQVIFKAVRGWMLMVLSTSLKVQGRGSLFTHMLRLPASFFEARYLGDIVSRFGSMEVIQRALTTELVEALLDGLLATATLIIMFVFSPLLASLVLLAVLLYGLLRWALYTPLREASMEAIVWAARRDNHFLETLRAIKTIKLFGGQNIRRAQWMNLLVETINRDLVSDKLRIVFRVADGLIFGMLNIGVICVGATLVLQNILSVGMLLAFIAYKSQFIDRITQLIDRAVDLKMLRLHSERLSDLVLTEPEAMSSTVGIGNVPASIEVKNLRFRYSEQDPWVLDDVSFKIEPGESVAIVGPSGCGKTTLLKILSSLLQETSGEVLIGGDSISHIGLENYRKFTSVVMQDDQLLAGSIADNISFFSLQPNRELIERCAKIAAVHEDVRAMAMGYESLIGDMGSSLSGGQKQRLLLARALYRKPKILLLDEATSHLDVKLERAVNQAIRQTNLTRIIVAHRPETIRSAQRVITLENGRVIGNLHLSGGTEVNPPVKIGRA